MTHDPIPDISIVIVSWNTKDDLALCLRAIPHAADTLAVEIIVVDNGSTDGSQAMLAEQFPLVQVIQNQDNVGYGRAMNIGARVSRGRALLILNSDCEVQPGALQSMVAELEREASIGMVLCRILNRDGSLQPSVHESFPSPWSQLGDLLFLPSLRYAMYRRPVLHRWLLRATVTAHQRTGDVAWGGGMCMMVRRDFFLSLKGFDERFFMYCEDMDLCKRIRDAGYRVRYLAEPAAVHGWGKSTEQAPQRMLCESYKSRILYFDKHFPGWGGTMSRWLTVAELRLRQILFSLMGVVPSPQRQLFQSQAKFAAECAHTLAGSAPPASVPGSDQADGLHFFLAVLIGFSLFQYLHDLVKFAVESPFIDFAHYYTYAKVVSLGLNPFDAQAVAQVDASLNIRRAGAAANYPPLFYLFMQPWASLPFRAAAIGWLLASQACLVLVLWFCIHRYGEASPLQVAVAVFVVLNYQPLMENLALGQSNVWLLLLLTLAWWGLRLERPWVSAVAVAVSVHIKIQYALLIPLLWWIGYRPVSFRALALAALGLGVGVLALGPAHHVEYVRYVMDLPEYLASWTANMSPRGTVHRLLATSGDGRLLADGLTLALDALFLGVFARVIPRMPTPDSSTLDWAWGAGLCVILLLSPLTEEHHLVVLLLPLMLLLLSDSVERMRASDLVVLVAAILLLGSRYSLEQFPVFHQGALSLLAAGKLVGVAGLAWVLVGRLRASARVDA